MKPATARARLHLSFEPMNFDVLNGVEGVEICCLYEFVKQFFRCLDVIHSINVENANEVGFKTGLPMGGLNLYRLDLKPKKAPLGYHVRWGTRHQKPFGNNIETESHMFKRKIVLKDVSKDALLFFHVFFFGGGGLGRCVTWDGFMLFYWSFAHVRQRPRVVQAARRLGEIPGNWDLFRCL